MAKSYELRILGVFVGSFAVYLLIALVVYAPLGHYGGDGDDLSLSDPWIDRVQTILDGGLLYRDVYTTTPPLINFLLMPPVLLSAFFGHRNPWATLSFMTYFSLFNLFAAYVLLYMAKERKEGYYSALYFLLNPLTFGNALLRRQDESILVFFFSLALLFILHQRHWWASVVIGATTLVKLSGALIVPIAFLQTRDWKYLIVPAAVFALVFAPFLLAAGESAVFWDVSERNTQHPFQLDGISLGFLWARGHDKIPLISLEAHSVIFVVGVCAAGALVIFRPKGLLEDLALLTTTVLFLSPKLHCGYFALVVLMMAPLVRRCRVGALYLLSGPVILAADLCKANPVRNYNLALVLMVVGFSLLIAAVVRMWWLCGARNGVPVSPVERGGEGE